MRHQCLLPIQVIGLLHYFFKVLVNSGAVQTCRPSSLSIPVLIVKHLKKKIIGTKILNYKAIYQNQDNNTAINSHEQVFMWTQASTHLSKYQGV